MKSKIDAAAEKVEGNNMLLTFILIRLPPKSVFRFRCVSKRWNNIITMTYFLRSYSNANISRNKDGLINSGDQRLLAFIQLTREHLDDRRRRLNCNSGVAELISTLRVPRELETDYFFNSSNGLILCGSYSSKYTCLHVWNPLTQKRISLPRPEIPNHLHNIMSIGLPTGTWVMSTVVSTGHFVLATTAARLIMLPLPYELTTCDSSFSRTSKHDDVLWFCNIDQSDQHMQFWMLPNNHKDGLKNNIERKKSLLRRFFKLSDFVRKQKPESSDLFFWLEALIPCNPIVVVLRRGDKVFLYNLETKSIESVLYPRGSAQSRWHPYMETLLS
ncbi:hypothetical protein ACJIZ3_010376 [Penstemon smallii]|uniref:F-box domain-containing protein n=1 Tax=Penstemon smallii TaxID=265156 RepID=A0ABD3TF57_9LAMI